MTLIHSNVKEYNYYVLVLNILEYLLSLNHHALVRLMVEVDMFSVFPYYGLEKKKKNTIFFDINCNDSYLMKCLHNNISQNDTIW